MLLQGLEAWHKRCFAHLQRSVSRSHSLNQEWRCGAFERAVPKRLGKVFLKFFAGLPITVRSVCTLARPLAFDLIGLLEAGERQSGGDLFVLKRQELVFGKRFGMAMSAKKFGL
jgi:hypothetical protein